MKHPVMKWREAWRNEEKLLYALIPEEKMTCIEKYNLQKQRIKESYEIQDIESIIEKEIIEVLEEELNKN